MDEDGESRAYINMISNLRLAKTPADKTVIHSGTFLIKPAGSKKNWDVGLCSLVYRDNLEDQEPPTMEDYFFVEKNSWFDGKTTPAKMAEELHDCRETRKNKEGIEETKNCLDIN